MPETRAAIKSRNVRQEIENCEGLTAVVAKQCESPRTFEGSAAPPPRSFLSPTPPANCVTKRATAGS